MTKKRTTLRDKFLDETLKRLKIDNELLTERMKIFEKRLDFMQDDVARIAVEEQALITSLKYINSVAHDLLDRKGVPDQSKDSRDETKNPAYQ